MTDSLMRSIGGSWFCDGWDPNLKIFHRLRSTLYEAQSQYQHIEICDTHSFGRMLVIDDLPQAAESDEAMYAKSLAWPALLGVRGMKRVLIAGGGDGHVLRECLRFRTVKSVVVCDIDPLVTQATSEFMPFMWAGVSDDPRADIRHMDVLALLANASPGSFDIVISDITDPAGDGTASHPLYSSEYFRLIRRCLVDSGICAAQAQELSIREWGHHQRLRRFIGKSFPALRSGYVYIPSFGYPEGLIFASDELGRLVLNPSEVTSRLQENGVADDPHLDAEMYASMFVLPPLLRAELGTRTDADPIS